MVFANREKIVQVTIQQKLPAIFEYKQAFDPSAKRSSALAHATGLPS